MLCYFATAFAKCEEVQRKQTWDHVTASSTAASVCVTKEMKIEANEDIKSVMRRL